MTTNNDILNFQNIMKDTFEWAQSHPDVFVQMGVNVATNEIPTTLAITLTDAKNPNAWNAFDILPDRTIFQEDDSDDMDENEYERLDALRDNLVLDYLRKA